MGIEAACEAFWETKFPCDYGYKDASGDEDDAGTVSRVRSMCYAWRIPV